MKINLHNKFLKLLSDPIGVINRRFTYLYEKIYFRASHDYKTNAYWNYRHKKFGFNLRGVGNISLSHDENIKLLNEGSEVLIKVCRNANVNFTNAQVLDIGCGTSHFLWRSKPLRNI